MNGPDPSLAATSNEISDYHLTGRNAYARLQRRTIEGKPADFAHQRQAGPDRAVRIRLVGLGVSEICEYSVAQVVGDKASVTLDHGRAPPVIFGHDRTQNFGIDPR